MPIPSITAVASKSRVTATPRVKAIRRETDAPFYVGGTEADGPVFFAKHHGSGEPEQQPVRSAGSPASRSSAAVQQEISRLKLGG